MNQLLRTALQAEADKMREEMRKQAFCAFVCVVCLIIISCVIIGAGFRRVAQMIEARQAAKAGAEKAQALEIYVRSRGATWTDVRNEIARSLGAGAIKLDRAERLMDFLDEAKACHESYGKEIDTASGDWVQLGDGCHQRKNHLTAAG